SDSDNPTTTLFARGDGGRGGGGDFSPLRLYSVFGRIRRLNRQKCAGTDMQRHKRPIDTATFELFHEPSREVQASRRSSHCACAFRVDSLVTLAVGVVASSFPDVWRQRHLAVS